ncbi:class I SAM-dependent methyltransferase [Archangium minus]|uniref:Class I SAM-dependent methyltransferase n=1 Tax=Archangium minus TaxID=83450 RepID=A0ABY9WT11_9BACT|nr:class I SAM-dependent methyltransferase [Archangium minus]
MGKQSRKKKLERERKQAIEAAKTLPGLTHERELYAKSWSQHDAAKFAQDAHYAWMASFTAGYDRILEIGTGDGRGTIELLRAGHSVVSIDENPACLHIAQRKIEAAGFAVAVEQRETLQQGNDGYAITYKPPTSNMPVSGALLLEGDLLNDPSLLAWLKGLPRFDAVVCWLMGSHRARPFNTALEPLPAGAYRLRVQNQVYRLADTVLRTGGILHIVDRAEISSSEKMAELLRLDTQKAHEEQASAFSSLRVDPRIEARPYEPPEKPGVLMGMTPGLSGRIPMSDKTGLVSIISRKP